MTLPETVQTPHFDRTAFKVKRIFVTLAADGATANFKFSAEEQALKCAAAPAIFTPVPGAWGAQGWTTANLRAASHADLRAALTLAHAHALGPKRKGSSGSSNGAASRCSAPRTAKR